MSKSKFINTLSESKYNQVIERKVIVGCFVKREYFLGGHPVYELKARRRNEVDTVLVKD